MVLCLKTRENRSLPGLSSSADAPSHHDHASSDAAGRSSPVARQAHNLKVGGSNPPPATIFPYRTATQPRPQTSTDVMPPPGEQVPYAPPILTATGSMLFSRRLKAVTRLFAIITQSPRLVS